MTEARTNREREREREREGGNIREKEREGTTRGRDNTLTWVVSSGWPGTLWHSVDVHDLDVQCGEVLEDLFCHGSCPSVGKPHSSQTQSLANLQQQERREGKWERRERVFKWVFEWVCSSEWSSVLKEESGVLYNHHFKLKNDALYRPSRVFESVRECKNDHHFWKVTSQHVIFMTVGGEYWSTPKSRGGTLLMCNRK